MGKTSSKWLSGIVTGVLGALLCLSFGHAATINVPADQPTIQAGIDAAVNGDTVLVAPGTYTGKLTIFSKDIHLMSSDGPSETFYTIPSGTGSAITISNANSVMLEGFGITNQAGAENTLRVITASNCSVTIRNNRFINITSVGALIFLDGSSLSMSRITRNVFHNVVHGNAMIVNVESHHLAMVNNTIDKVVRGVAALTSLSVISSNIFTNCSVYGITLVSSATEEYNDFWGNVVDRAGGAISSSDLELDPLFVDASNDDFDLLPNSPCIDAGNPDALFNDLDGTRNDMGALFFDHCIGVTGTDSDGDGRADSCDICPNDFLNDLDHDGICGDVDNCPNFFNPDQVAIDSDGDLFPDACDNCPLDFNSAQADSDNDGIGDICDLWPNDPGNDIDQDGISGEIDNCPNDANSTQVDSDSDGNGDACDICPGLDDFVDTDSDGNPDGCDICEGFDDNLDTDSDGVPDGCDLCNGFNDSSDSDNDGVPDGCDICTGFNDSLDNDEDSVPDGCDICPNSDDTKDTDSDSHPDGCDNCPNLFNQSQTDFDNDSIGNGCDNCLFEFNPVQTDSDSDGIGDSCDPCTGVPGECTPCCNLAGNANNDGAVNIADVTYVIAWLFTGGPDPSCADEGDANSDNKVNIADVTYVIAWLFAAGPDPACGTTGL